MPTPPATLAQFKAQFDRDFTFGTGRETVRDLDLNNAQTAGSAMFNPELWVPGAETVYAFNLVTAHFLALSVQAAGGLSARPLNQGAKSQGGGVAQNKSAGPVSLGYDTSYISKRPLLAQFMRTDYGQQYLALLVPRLVGNVGVVLGPRDPDVSIPNIPFMV